MRLHLAAMWLTSGAAACSLEHPIATLDAVVQQPVDAAIVSDVQQDDRAPVDDVIIPGFDAEAPDAVATDLVETADQPTTDALPVDVTTDVVTDAPVACGAFGERCCEDDAGARCALGLACIGAVCECAMGQFRCGGACVDTRTNGSHCGACGTSCEAGRLCIAGLCAPAPPGDCTGGTVSEVPGFRVHVFSMVGAAMLTCATGGSVEYLVIGGGGGGGGGGRNGGGGGAGGYLSGNTMIGSGSTPVRVGGGGAVGMSGTPSSLGAVVTVGGGGGGFGDRTRGAVGLAGGSGGGGGFKDANAGGAGTAGQGFAGGRARDGNYTSGGGGGGAGGAGAIGAGDRRGEGGNGGPGRMSDITGTAVMRAGGGAGRGEHQNGTASAGGGNAMTAGAANTGGGGGGDAAGGSGVVIVRYRR